MGPHLGNNLVNLGIYGELEQAIAELGLDLHELLQQEKEPGLGNGGRRELSEVIDLIRTGCFSRGDVELFRPLVDNLLLHDPYLVLTDFRSYVECHTKQEWPTPTASAGRRCPSSIPPALENFPPTALLASTPNRPGTQSRADQDALPR